MRLQDIPAAPAVPSMLGGFFFGKWLFIEPSALTLSLVIALLNNIDQPGGERRIARTARLVGLDTLIPCLVSAAALAHPALKPYNLDTIGATIIAGLLSVAMPLLRSVLPELWQRVKEPFLGLVAAWVAVFRPRSLPPSPQPPNEGGTE